MGALILVLACSPDLPLPLAIRRCYAWLRAGLVCEPMEIASRADAIVDTKSRAPTGWLRGLSGVHCGTTVYHITCNLA